MSLIISQSSLIWSSGCLWAIEPILLSFEKIFSVKGRWFIELAGAKSWLDLIGMLESDY